MSIFAEVGSSFQQIGGECPEGWVVMQGERPTIAHVAHSDGTWGLPIKSETELAAEAREAFKAQRALDVAAIKVTSSLGRTFDGGEVDTQRMLEPIAVLKEKPEGTTTVWVLADNSVAEVALPEFLEVLELAGLEKTRLWVQP